MDWRTGKDQRMVSEEDGGQAPRAVQLPPHSQMGVKTETRRVDFPQQIRQTEMLKIRHGNGEGTYSPGSWRPTVLPAPAKF